MVIRLATPEDKSALVAMSLHFLRATIYGGFMVATAEGIEELVDLFFDNDPTLSTIFVAADEAGPFGMIAATAAVVNGSDELYADERVWWVEPSRRGLDAGPRLWAALEDWAVQNGMIFVKMVAPAGSTIGRAYEKRGYRAIETAYAKRLT